MGPFNYRINHYRQSITIVNHNHQSLSSITIVNHYRQSLLSITIVNHYRQSLSSITIVNHNHLSQSSSPFSFRAKNRSKHPCPELNHSPADTPYTERCLTTNHVATASTFPHVQNIYCKLVFRKKHYLEKTLFKKRKIFVSDRIRTRHLRLDSPRCYHLSYNHTS